MKKKWKTGLLITLIVIGVLVVAAVVIGVLNATVFDGSINFGWTDYRYDDKGYSVGEGTVYAEEITAIDVDWLDGNVQIVVCEDRYFSISEFSQESLTDAMRVHWSVSEDGKTLTVKCRESAWFLGSSAKKDLILRIPERLMGAITSLTVRAQESEINCSLSTVPATLSLENEKGNVTLEFLQNADFAVTWTHREGKLITDFAVKQEGNRYIAGAGKSEISVSTKYRGDLSLLIQK